MTGAPVRFYTHPADLQALRRCRPGNTDTRGRARWLVRFYRARTYLDLAWNADELSDRFGINERTFDACFEMGDGAEVLAELMPLALQDEKLRAAMIEHIGQRSFDAWCQTAANESRQLDLL